MIPNKTELSDSELLIESGLFTPEWLQRPYSWVGHIPFASWLVRRTRPKVFVELGTHSGNSYFTICQSAAKFRTGTKCFAVDTWQGDAHSFSYSGDIFEMVNAHNSERYRDFSTLMRMTFDEALGKFEPGTVDLLHIDGLHTYDAVKHDFVTWLPKLAPGAMVLFHDTNVFKDDFGVWKLWAEIKDRHAGSAEFAHSFGLGVLRLADPALPSENSSTLLQSQELEFFAAAGKRHEMADVEFANQKHLAQVRELWSQRDQLAIKCDELKGEIARTAGTDRDELAARCRVMEAENARLKASLSWKFTYPLRTLRDLFTGR